MFLTKHYFSSSLKTVRLTQSVQVLGLSKMIVSSYKIKNFTLNGRNLC